MVQENVNAPAPRLVIVLGPTATGKTGICLELAGRFPFEIVNCDASQFYVGLDIGTAKPDLEERGRAPHHLFDIAPPDQPLNAGEYVKLADGAIEQIRSRNRLPLLVGGTGLYIRALTHGLAQIPAVAPEVQQRIRRRLELAGPEELHRELANVDPAGAMRISPNDPQRISRALEVYEQTGRPISVFQEEHGFAPCRYHALKVGLRFEPDELKKRIASRVVRMFDCGFPEEVARLLKEGCDFELRTLKALGYREVADYVQGHSSREEAVEQVVRLHQRYAKRQRTWFGRDSEIKWFGPEEHESLFETVGGFVVETAECPCDS